MASTEQREVGRVYLDNAATSWPKSAAVVRAVQEFVQQCGAASGRGTYESAQVADRWLELARRDLARLIGGRSGTDVAICSSGTHALNAALFGLLRPGDHVVTTAIEHNSLLRPLQQLHKIHGIQFSVVPVDSAGYMDPGQVKELATSKTRMVALGHASNVTGIVNDLSPWAAVTREVGALLLVDASQTLGYRPIDVGCGVDVLVAAGHKGLGAFSGTGLLYLNGVLHAELAPLMLGGTGLLSNSLDSTGAWPQTVEVGNLNMPGVVSMAVAAEDLLNEPRLLDSWREPFQALALGLREVSGLTLLGDWDELHVPVDPGPVDRVPVVSVIADGWDVHDLATVLDTSFQIEARAGWHCAALVHENVGSADTNGTLRLSPGRRTSRAEIDYTLRAFREILG